MSSVMNITNITVFYTSPYQQMMVNATTVAYKKLAERVNINEIVAGTNITRFLDMVTTYKELAIFEYNGLVCV